MFHQDKTAYPTNRTSMAGTWGEAEHMVVRQETWGYAQRSEAIELCNYDACFFGGPTQDCRLLESIFQILGIAQTIINARFFIPLYKLCAFSLSPISLT
jgi:hypothetical protein